MHLIWLWFIALLLSSCSTTYLTLKSDPEGATVYAVPKLIWDIDSNWYSNPAHLNAYIIKEGATPTHTGGLRKAPYVMVFVIGEKRKHVAIDLSQTGRKSGRTVEADLR